MPMDGNLKVKADVAAREICSGEGLPGD